MNVERWMTRRVHVARPLDSIQHARELMVTHRINQLPVVVDGRVVGIVTDRDLRDAFPSVFDAPVPDKERRGKSAVDPNKIRVEAVMTENVVTVGPTDSATDAARVMRRERIGALPVVAGNRLVGIIARSDLLDAFVALAEAAESGQPG